MGRARKGEGGGRGRGRVGKIGEVTMGRMEWEKGKYKGLKS